MTSLEKSLFLVASPLLSLKKSNVSPVDAKIWPEVTERKFKVFPPGQEARLERTSPKGWIGPPRPNRGWPGLGFTPPRQFRPQLTANL